MKRFVGLMALILGCGLIIGFSGCIIDKDTISKADRCGMANEKCLKNCGEGWDLNECMYFPNATVSCVLNASGANKEDTCDSIDDCFDLAWECNEEAMWLVYYECNLDELIGLESWYDAWEQCVTEWDLECIFDAESCGELAMCFGVVLLPD